MKVAIKIVSVVFQVFPVLLLLLMMAGPRYTLYNEVDKFGFITLMLVVCLPLFFTHIFLSYKYDRETFEKLYNRDRLIFIGAAFVVVGFAMYKLS